MPNLHGFCYNFLAKLLSQLSHFKRQKKSHTMAVFIRSLINKSETNCPITWIVKENGISNQEQGMREYCINVYSIFDGIAYSYYPQLLLHTVTVLLSVLYSNFVC